MEQPFDSNDNNQNESHVNYNESSRFDTDSSRFDNRSNSDSQYQSQSQSSGMYGQKPNNYLVWAILTTLCCCLPFGIVAIIKANEVNSLWAMKQYDNAMRSASDAKKWCIVAACVGLCLNLIVLFFYGAVFFAALKGQGGTGPETEALLDSILSK